MPRTLTLGVIQTAYGEDMDANIAKTAEFVREAAAAKGAQVILPSELFQGPYFCVTQEEKWFATAYPVARASLRHRARPAGGRTGRGDPDLDL